ncbi:hypothetical protein MBLNU13_g03328t1 [Cladosporium sp. NU13]
MASRFSKGDYVAQIFAYESDLLRLLHQVQQYVAAGNALYAAVFTCRYSGNPSAIEKRAIATGSSRRPHFDLDHDRSTKATSTARQGLLDGDLTLTLLHIDTTWRFDSFENRQASPMLSWPAIRKLYTPGAFLDGDLILKDQHVHPAVHIIPPSAAHVLHIEIDCSTNSDAAVIEIAQQLRSDLHFWNRQLFFEADPAQAQEPQTGVKYVLLMEVDTRHTAETLASSLNTDSLRKLSGERLASALVRIFTLEGSALYHDMTPQDIDEHTIDNRTHSQVLDNDQTPEPKYFGLPATSYVHH